MSVAVIDAFTTLSMNILTATVKTFTLPMESIAINLSLSTDCI